MRFPIYTPLHAIRHLPTNQESGEYLVMLCFDHRKCKFDWDLAPGFEAGHFNSNLITKYRPRRVRTIGHYTSLAQKLRRLAEYGNWSNLRIKGLPNTSPGYVRIVLLRWTGSSDQIADLVTKLSWAISGNSAQEEPRQDFEWTLYLNRYQTQSPKEYYKILYLDDRYIYKLIN